MLYTILIVFCQAMLPHAIHLVFNPPPGYFHQPVCNLPLHPYLYNTCTCICKYALQRAINCSTYSGTSAATCVVQPPPQTILKLPVTAVNTFICTASIMREEMTTVVRSSSSFTVPAGGLVRRKLRTVSSKERPPHLDSGRTRVAPPSQRFRPSTTSHIPWPIARREGRLQSLLTL